MKNRLLILLCLLLGLAFSGQVAAQVAVERSTEIVKVSGKEYYMHHVKSGQTLYGISQVYNVTVEELETLNPEVKNGLKAGDVIGIPVRHEKVEPEKPAVTPTVPKAEQEKPQSNNQNSGNHTVTSGNSVPAVQVGQEYVVQKDEDLYDIAKKFGIDVGEFKALNPGLSESPRAGTVIKVPSIVNTDDYIVHKVEYNERTTSLLRRWRVSESEFRQINISVGSHVFVNQVVLIPIARVNSVVAPLESEIVVEDVQPSEAEQNVVYEEEEEPVEAPECHPSADNARKHYKVALMVPLYLNDVGSLEVSKERISKAQKSRSMSFLQFYEGFMMAAESLSKNSGLKLDLKVIDVTDNVSTAHSALSQIEGEELDMIVGPFFGKSFDVVEEYAKAHGIIMINPLSTRESVVEGNPNVVKVKAGPAGQILGVSNLVKKQYSGSNVFIISAEKDSDTAFLNALEHRLNRVVNAEVSVSNEAILNYAIEESGQKEMGERIMPTVEVEGQVYSTSALDANVQGGVVIENPIKRYAYSDVGSLKSQLSGVRDNLIIAYGSTNVFATQVLNTLKRDAGHKPITLVALPSWVKFEKLLVEDLLDMNAIYFSDHFVDYTDDKVKRFVLKFREKYKSEPQQYAFEGYDVAWYFLNALMQYGSDMIGCLPSCEMPLLHTQYHFVGKGNGNGVENQSWSVYQYDGKSIQLNPLDPYKTSGNE